MSASEWPLWEVFIRSNNGLDHKHVGSLHAADAEMAIDNARDYAQAVIDTLTKARAA